MSSSNVKANMHAHSPCCPSSVPDRPAALLISGYDLFKGVCWPQVCGQAYDVYPLHSAYIDWCFKVPHLRTAGKQRLGEDDSTAQSGTGKYFVSDKEVLEHLQDPCASAPPPDDGKTCSDFKADEVSSACHLVIVCPTLHACL